MNLPSISSYCYNGNYGTHALVADVGPIRVWQSYKTPIAFHVDGHERVVRVNSWGPTTGKHLNAIDGGEPVAKKARVSGAEFERLWAEQVEPLLAATV